MNKNYKNNQQQQIISFIFNNFKQTVNKKVPLIKYNILYNNIKR